MALIINTISSKPDYSVTTTDGRITFPLQDTIWSLVSPQLPTWYVDGSGSTKPILFSRPEDNSEQWTIPVDLVGVFVFPQSWSGKYRLQAFLKDIKDPVFESDDGAIPPPTGNPIPFPIKINTLKMIAPCENFMCPIPFGYKGDFEWKIINVNAECKPCQPRSDRVITRSV